LSAVPELDAELRRRLGRRFGPEVGGWLDALPPVLAGLAERWRLDYGSLIQRGSMSVVIRCTTDRRPAVLKVSPDRDRIRDEAAALARWRTPHVPAVLATDGDSGALLIEAIEPGTPLAESAEPPRPDTLAALLAALHAGGVPDPSYRPVAARVAHLFDAGLSNYRRRPDLRAVVPEELYERGRRLATRLTDHTPATVLLHGDLTPVNVLDGGPGRGLVAIDPAPCLGDPAFDAVDLVFWRADDARTVLARAEQLASAIGADAERLLHWCAAFAAMIALEIAEASTTPDPRVAPFVAFAEAGT
jgi:streptomycin 6-kinase